MSPLIRVEIIRTIEQRTTAVIEVEETDERLKDEKRCPGLSMERPKTLRMISPAHSPAGSRLTAAMTRRPKSTFSLVLP